MSAIDDLLEIASEIEALAGLYQTDHYGASYLPREARGAFQRLIEEAGSVISAQLDDPSTEHIELLTATVSKHGRYTGPGPETLSHVGSVIRGAVRKIRRLTGEEPAKEAKDPYASPVRIAELAAIQGRPFDTKRLVQMCQELNAARVSDSHISTIMLVRGIIDHVPPIFGKRNFAEVANNVAQKSLKDSLLHLENSSRKIADRYLHGQISKTESLPTSVQVDFSRDLDVLLGEIVSYLT